MPLYQYRGRNQRGEAVKGQLEAASPDVVATQLFNSGITPIDINLTKATKDVFALLRSRLGGGKVELVDLILFSRQMYTLLRAGVPIMQALRGLRESTQNLAFVRVLAAVGESLDTGLDLSTALKRHPKVFPPLFISMVQVGETTGSLEDVFQQLSAYLEREKDTRERVKSALRYPMFVMIAMAIALVVINIFVIPAFLKVFASFKIALPLPTRILIATSKFTVAYWPYLLGTLAATVFLARNYVRTANGRYKWHRFKLKLPVAGKVIYKATLARFAHSLAVIIKAGVPLVAGMTVVSRAVDNDYISERIQQMRDGVERGETITRTAQATGMFPPLVVQMISVGEESGAVDSLMSNVGEYYDREVDYDIKNLSTAIQPILIIFMGILVLILALGVFLPMWDLVQAARK
jgi:MSHA biogenesis protein MshG